MTLNDTSSGDMPAAKEIRHSQLTNTSDISDDETRPGTPQDRDIDLEKQDFEKESSAQMPSPPTPISAANTEPSSITEPQHEYEKLAQKHPKPTDHLSITIGPPIILFLDLIVPCIIYYTWYNHVTKKWRQACNLPSDIITTTANESTICSIPKPEFDKDILGYAVISFGFGELYILIARIYRLFAHRDECAPLLSKSRWELDATSWVYAVAMIIALIPFVTGSTLEIPKLYLYGPAFLMAFLGILMLATLLPISIPVGINSHPRGTKLRPFIYYAAEDFIAVDGLQDRDFRRRYNHRYEQSAGFRRMFVYLTLWWMVGVVSYIGCLSAVIWTLEFHYAFGLSLGVLFSYIIIWACSSYVYVKFEMHRERIKFERFGRF